MALVVREGAVHGGSAPQVLPLHHQHVGCGLAPAVRAHSVYRKGGVVSTEPRPARGAQRTGLEWCLGCFCLQGTRTGRVRRLRSRKRLQPDGLLQEEGGYHEASKGMHGPHSMRGIPEKPLPSLLSCYSFAHLLRDSAWCSLWALLNERPGLFLVPLRPYSLKTLIQLLPAKSSIFVIFGTSFISVNYFDSESKRLTFSYYRGIFFHDLDTFN